MQHYTTSALEKTLVNRKRHKLSALLISCTKFIVNYFELSVQG